MELTKLTLSTPPDIVGMAKRQAKQRGMSVSAMFVAFIRANERRANRLRIPPCVERLTGVLDAPPDFDYRRELDTALAARYEA